MERRRNFVRYKMKNKYIIDRNFVRLDLNKFLNDDKLIIDFSEVEFISRAASHEILVLKNKKNIIFRNHKHLILKDKIKILSSLKRNNQINLIDEDKNFDFRNSLKDINFY